MEEMGYLADESGQLALMDPENFQKNTNYQKSNMLIGAKYRSTILENKILAIALSRIQEAAEDSEGSIIINMKAAELKKLTGITGHAFYKRLDATASAMTGRTVGVSNPEKETFEYISVINHAVYDGGIFTLEFSKHLRKYLKDIASSYTILNLETVLTFSDTYTFRLYELIKSKSYTPKGSYNPTNCYRISFSIAELKLDLGICNAELDSVKKILNDSPNPSFEKAVDASPEKMFNNWTDLRRKVIDPSVKQINEKTDLQVGYEVYKSGRGGAVRSIDFLVSYKSKAQEKQEERDEMDLCDEIRDYMQENMRSKDILAMLKEAGGDVDVVKSAYDRYESAKSTENIDNPVGYIISQIRWPREAKEQKKKQNQFMNFKQRQIDYEELEKEMLTVRSVTHERFD